MSANLFGQGNWLRSAGSIANEEISDATIDSNGDLIMTGFFSGSFNSGVGTLTSTGNTDIVVIKTNDSGDPIWAVSAGGTGVDRANGIASDNAGNTYITGFFQGSATFGGINVSGQGYEAYAAKIDVNGNFVWVTTFGGAFGDIGHGIDVDNLGNVICVGEYKGAATFGPTLLNSQVNPVTGSASSDIFITKLNNSGNFVWTEDGNAKYDDRATGVTVDNNGSIYVIGEFSDTLQFQNTHFTSLLNAGFMVSYDQAGNELWFDKMWGSQVLLTDCEWQNNKVFVTGDFRGNIIVEDINNLQNFLAQDEYNIFASRFSDNGDLDWLSSNYSNTEVHSNQLTVDSNNDIYLTGNFKCTFTEMNSIYGPSTFLSLGFEDVHYLKYNYGGTFSWARQVASNQGDYSSSIVIKNPDLPIIAGSHESSIYVPAGGSFSFLPGQQVTTGASNCGDANYGNFAMEDALGQRDFFWSSPFDISRLPFDYYEKNPGLGCDLNTYPPCIGDLTPFNLCEDTLYGCSPLTAILNEFFLNGNNQQPNTTTTWSTGQIGLSTTMSVDGNYTATTTTEDQCYTWTDFVYVSLYPEPDVPLITDSWSYNDHMNPANDIDTCDADSVFLWGTPVGSITDSLVWSPGIFVNDSTISANHTGDYTVVAVNEFGCESAGNSINIIINNFALHDTLDPYIVFTDGSITDTDSVISCGLPFCSTAYLIDSNFINIYGTMPNLYSIWFIDGVYFDTLYHNSDDSIELAIPSQIQYCVNDTGWHTLSSHLVNECGDTIDYFMAESFYVDTIADPFINVSGPLNACPGDTIMITAIYYTDTVIWSGNAIIQNFGDSVLAVVDMTNGVNITATVDTSKNTTTCTSEGQYYIAPFPIPQLSINPADGIICPGDSVMLSALGGTAWQWIGPTGDSLGTGQNQYVSDVGDYFCFVTDNGCVTPSEFISTFAYSSPTLYLWDPVVCKGDSATIELLGPANMTFNWFAPLSGPSSVQFADSAGYYYVESSFCGITKLDSVFVLVSEPLSAFTMPSDTTICPYETVNLNAPPGMQEYQWNGVIGTDTYQVLDSGIYYLHVTDTAGCTDDSDTIHVHYHALPVAPLASDTTICPGGNVSLSAIAAGSIDWYDNSGTYISSGNPLNVPNVTSATYYLVTNTDAFCASLPDTASVVIFPDTTVADFQIIDNCGSLAIQVISTGTANISYNWDMGDLTTYNGNPINHTYGSNGTYTITLNVSDPTCGFSDSHIDSVTLYGQSITSLTSDPVCFQYSDGSVTMSLIGALGGETFVIENSSGTQVNAVGSNTANLLPAGWYYMYAELGPGCTIVDSVELTDPGELLADFTFYPPLCYGGVGSVVIDTVINWQGDPNNISYIWNPNPAGIGGVGADSSYNMPAGMYSLSINDDNGCSNANNFELIEPSELVLNEFDQIPSDCRIYYYQSGNGVVYAAAQGGTPAYTYFWTNLETGDTANTSTWGGLEPGNYQIQVTDANNCVLTESIFLDSINPIADFDMSSLDFTAEWEGNSPVNLHFDNTSLNYISLNNPAAVTTFSWNFDFNDGPWVLSSGINQSYDTVYTEGFYTICLAMTNFHGCEDTLCKDLIVYPNVDFAPVNIFTPDGDGVNDEFTFVYKAYGIEIFECIVVNRWGVVMKEFYSIYSTWDGTNKKGEPCSDGVYFYVYSGTGENGDEFNGQGSVTIIGSK